jgi:hypothetical protein
MGKLNFSQNNPRNVRRQKKSEVMPHLIKHSINLPQKAVFGDYPMAKLLRRWPGIHSRLVGGWLGLLLLPLAVMATPPTPTLQYTFDNDLGNTNAADTGVAPQTNANYYANNNGASAASTISLTTNTPSGYGYALNLVGANSGVNNFIQCGNPAKLNNITNLTLTCWLNLQGDPAQNDRIWDKTVTGPLGWSFNFATGPATNISLFFSANVNTGTFNSTGINASNRWVFLALTFNGSAITNNLVLYAGSATNAVSAVGTLTLAQTSLTNNAGLFRVGSTAASGSDRTPPAWLDDVRIYTNAALSAADLELVRQEEATPVMATPPTPTLQYTFDNDLGNTYAADTGVAPQTNANYYANNNGATAASTISLTTNTPSGYGYALNLVGANSGVNNFIQCGNPAKLNNIKNLTLTCWLNLQGDPALNDRIWDKTVTGPLGWSFNFATGPATNISLFFTANVSSGTFNSTGVNASNQWVFLALTFNGDAATNNLVLYAGSTTNAVSAVRTLTLAQTSLTNNAGLFRMGSTAASGSDRTPPAWLDDVRVYANAVLSAADLELVRGQVATPGVIVSVSPSQAQVLAGANVVLTASAIGFGAQTPTYQWLFNQNAIAGASSSGLTLNNVQITNSGTYGVVVSNNVACITNNGILLTVVNSSSGGLESSWVPYAWQTGSTNEMGSISILNPNIKYVGRFCETSPNDLYFKWPGSTVDLRFQGTSLQMSAKGTHYFRIIIDGNTNSMAKVYVNSTSFYKVFSLASGLVDGTHTAEIILETGPDSGNAAISGFTIDAGHKLLPPDPRCKRTIDFYGDSITAGFRADKVTGTFDTGASTDTAYFSYGSQVARTFNAEAHLIAWAGLACTPGYGHVTGKYLQSIYNLTCPDVSTQTWDFTQRNAPDIVVINILQNDYATSSPEDATTNAYISLLTAIRGTYPAAHIICAAGDLTLPNSPTYMRYMSNSVNGYKTAAHDDNVGILIFPYKNTPNHPSIEEHTVMANLLTAYIQANTVWGRSAEPLTSPTILSMGLDGTHTNMMISVSTVAGYSYVLESAPGLESSIVWTPILTNTSTGGTITNLVPVTPTSLKRFYHYLAR